jgi:hypothetical protein
MEKKHYKVQAIFDISLQEEDVKAITTQFGGDVVLELVETLAESTQVGEFDAMHYVEDETKNRFWDQYPLSEYTTPVGEVVTERTLYTVTEWSGFQFDQEIEEQ